MRWGFLVKPAPRAAESVGPQPELLRRKYSGRWRTPGTLFPFRPGCGRILGLPMADVSSCGVLFRVSVASIQPLGYEVTRPSTASGGPNHTCNGEDQVAKTGKHTTLPAELPRYGGNCRTLFSPFVRPQMRLLARLEGLTTASFFLYVTICVHFPLTEKKACHTIWTYQHLSKPVKCCPFPFFAKTRVP